MKRKIGRQKMRSYVCLHVFFNGRRFALGMMETKEDIFAFLTVPLYFTKIPSLTWCRSPNTSLKDYSAALSEIRSHLASGDHSRTAPSVIAACENYLQTALSCITAMQGLGEIENDVLKIRTAKQRMEREISPLSNEIHQMKKDLLKKNRQQQQRVGESFAIPLQAAAKQHPLQPSSSDFSDLFGRMKPQQQQGGSYTPPVIKGLNEREQDDLLETQALLQSSHGLLLESQALCNESETIGNNVLSTMYSQREQLEMSSARVGETTNNMLQARRILKQM